MINNNYNNPYANFKPYAAFGDNFAFTPAKKKDATKESIDIKFNKSDIPGIASLAFMTSLIDIIPNWDKIAKGSAKYKAGHLSAVATASVLIATGLVSVYKIAEKFLKEKWNINISD